MSLLINNKRGSFVTDHLSFLSSSSAATTENNKNLWCEVITIHDQDKLFLCIERLSNLSAVLLEKLLLLSSASTQQQKQQRTIELSALSRAADATRSLTRAIGGLVVAAAAAHQKQIQNHASSTLLFNVVKPWLKRMEIILQNSNSSSSVTSPPNQQQPKKASESNWDDSSSDEEELLESKDLEGNVGSSVTKTQEKECVASALSHLSHVVVTSASSGNENSNNNYEEERIEFVKKFILQQLLTKKNDEFEMTFQDLSDSCAALKM